MCTRDVTRCVQRVILAGILATSIAFERSAVLADNPARDPPATSSQPADLPPLVRSVGSGLWSASTTWETGQVPAAGARVQIRAGHVVQYDLESDRVIRSIHVAGVLRFAHDQNTRLDVGLIKIQPGDDASENGFDCDAHLPAAPEQGTKPALEVGTPDEPLPAGRTALIRLAPVAGLDPQSCPAIVCCAGRMDFHGAPLTRTWLKLGANAVRGTSQVELEQPVADWRVGDRVIVTATERHGPQKSVTEERRIVRVEGARLTLDAPLECDHLGAGQQRGEVANLSRNVVVESADPDAARGHTMYHRNSAGAISYAEFRHLGKPGVLGRYSLHYHLVGNTMRGSYVRGASIWDSGNRWLTIHGTNFLIVRDCVGYRSAGHGFFLEDGTEVYNVLDRNLAVGARKAKPLPKQVLPFDGNEGAGFWWANSRNTFTRNVAAENDEYGYRFEATAGSAFEPTLSVLAADGTRQSVDIRTLPFIRFEDNEAHSMVGHYGLNLGEGVNRVGPDKRHPFVVRNFKVWDVHYGFRPQVPSLLVENLDIQAQYGVYHPNFDDHVYRNVVIRHTNTEPFNRGHDDLSTQYGRLTVDGLNFVDCRSGSQMPLIQISDNNMSGTAQSHFRNVTLVNWNGDNRRALVNRGGGPRPTPQTAKGVPIYLHDWFAPGRTAKIVSIAAPDLSADGLKYRDEPLLTGDESRMAEVEDMEFPQLLDPVDDLPPATVITQVVRRPGGELLVRGSASDNGAIVSIAVNGRPARALADNFAEWEMVLVAGDAGAGGQTVRQLEARGEDASGNREQLPHVVKLD